MPTLQVINREEDPDAKMLQSGSQAIAESILKAKTLQATKHYYDILGKGAETEAQKQQLEEKKQYLGLMERAQKIQDPEVRQAVVSAGLKVLHTGKAGGMDIMAGVGDDLMEISKTLKPDEGAASPEQLAGAQRENQLADAAKNRAEAKYYENPGAFMQALQGGGQGSPSGAGGFTPSQAVIRTPGGSITMENLAGEQAKARAHAVGAGQGGQQVSLRQVSEGVDTYLKTLDKAIQEVGGASRTGAQASLKAIMGQVNSPFKTDSAVAALTPQVDPLGLQIATFINGGKPTDKDAIVGSTILPRLEYPAATNKILKQRLKSMLSMKDPSAVFNMAEQTANIASVDTKFAEALRQQGRDDTYINKTLEEIHKQRGY